MPRALVARPCRDTLATITPTPYSIGNPPRGPDHTERHARGAAGAHRERFLAPGGLGPGRPLHARTSSARAHGGPPGGMQGLAGVAPGSRAVLPAPVPCCVPLARDRTAQGPTALGKVAERPPPAGIARGPVYTPVPLPARHNCWWR